jgi:hypothetical protein
LHLILRFELLDDVFGTSKEIGSNSQWHPPFAPGLREPVVDGVRPTGDLQRLISSGQEALPLLRRYQQWANSIRTWGCGDIDDLGFEQSRAVMKSATTYQSAVDAISLDARSTPMHVSTKKAGTADRSITRIGATV